MFNRMQFVAIRDSKNIHELVNQLTTKKCRPDSSPYFHEDGQYVMVIMLFWHLEANDGRSIAIATGQPTEEFEYDDKKREYAKSSREECLKLLEKVVQ